ncbi:Extracellular endo-alpha-like protein [Hapsidospora chrysogenum ATCC 11550]|uniref:Extracellular endo-alpha-like protein n=1 Tax=Hapsidospora chrysogenum (strain ATCC 11550 / CBS 779.69 / DSM 880 / IAM 14645 / JCM 23072 / IMI 49137) TaxID=857340 RepID=A0A086TE86_HAPC1|nr:Extracellular endo-alpha-like protein [Hapsidospora chrysogenum ATCC 11550]
MAEIDEKYNYAVVTPSDNEPRRLWKEVQEDLLPSGYKGWRQKITPVIIALLCITPFALIALIASITYISYLADKLGGNPYAIRVNMSTRSSFQPPRLRILHSGRNLQPRLMRDFPDPTLVEDHNGTWYAFATNSGGVNVQVARTVGNIVAQGKDQDTEQSQNQSDSDPLGPWTRLGIDAMPDRSWTSGRNTWAPDVQALDDGTFLMYFTGEVPNSHRHCIGTARANNVTGPYVPDPKPWACPLEEGGAIDPSGYVDEETGRRYVLYKVDGNSKSATWTPCGTDVRDPTMRTPLMLQQVDAGDGTTKIGSPMKLLDRLEQEDEALVEAPELRRWWDGTYLLFFSAHCFNDPRYNVKYAWANRIEGPYVRAEGALLQAPDFGLRAPGGAKTGRTRDGVDFIAFHGNCPQGRCFYTVPYVEA